MPIPAIPPVGASPAVDALARTRTSEETAGSGFGSLLEAGLQQVSALERAADRAAIGFAAGDGTKVHEVMIAGAKSQIAVDLLSQLRNKAVDAYTEIMRLQV